MKTRDSIPKYRKHRASGQAIVTLSGKMFYLGPHGTKASRLEYDRLVLEWLKCGRCFPQQEDDLTVVEVLAAYKRHAQEYYRKNGKPTREVGCIVEASQHVTPLYGKTPATDFGPLALQVVQQRMIEAGLCRTFINKQIGRIKRAFKWAVSQELISGENLPALLAVSGLRKGRTVARETLPIEPVDDAIVNATLEELPLIVADMVRFQRLTGCRPEEVCMIRPCDVDISGDVWAYRPQSHKTEHHERGRVIFIGPRLKTFCGRTCCAKRRATAFLRKIPNGNDAKKFTTAGKRPCLVATGRARTEKLSPSDRPENATPLTAIVGRFIALANWQRWNNGVPTGYATARQPRFENASVWKRHRSR
jgi:integrase